MGTKTPNRTTPTDEQEPTNLSKDKRPQVHGHGPDVQRHADGSIRRIEIEVSTGSYGDRSAKIRKLALTYRVTDGEARVGEIENTHGDSAAIESEHLRMLAFADDVVANVPGVEAVQRLERAMGDARETYERDLRERCAQEGCYNMPDKALGSRCREHTPREDR